MELTEKLKELALKSGLYECGYTEVSKIKIYPELRKACETNTCRKYDTKWTCPPGVGTLEECTQRVKKYRHMLLFSKKFELEDEFDIEGMAQGVTEFKKYVGAFEKSIEGLIGEHMFLTNEGCDRCENCTYPASPCRFPEKIHHSISGYGFFVSELARQTGIRYNNGKNTVTYLGALLY